MNSISDMEVFQTLCSFYSVSVRMMAITKYLSSCKTIRSILELTVFQGSIKRRILCCTVDIGPTKAPAQAQLLSFLKGPLRWKQMYPYSCLHVPPNLVKMLDPADSITWKGLNVISAQEVEKNFISDPPISSNSTNFLFIPNNSRLFRGPLGF